jgi:Arc/MetJ-type ribon-helix-helix transcriptional regulator
MATRYEGKPRFKRAEEEALDHLVRMGLFGNRDEAARAAILKYAMDIGVFDRRSVWEGLIKVRRRRVTADRLAKDLESLEDET